MLGVRSLSAILILSTAVLAQLDTNLRFDVAAIKPTPPESHEVHLRFVAGGVAIAGFTLEQLIRSAYRLGPYQISGGPAWLASDRYDISAKASYQPTPEQTYLMLRSLFADRFQLTFHRETRQLPVYVLVMARKDGKLGPKLLPSKEGSCTAGDPSDRALADAERVCGDHWINSRHLTTVSAAISDLTSMLSQILGRKVVDRTGLTGKFDINLNYAPEASQPASISNSPEAVAPEPSAPSIFAAFQGQLGLKLESQKGPVEILVIDRVERPSEN